MNLKNAQNHLKDQLSLHAEETATSLAFSLSNAAREGKSALMESMVDVIFDSGYYLSIRFTNTQGEVVVERSRSIEVEDVPAWFVKRFDIPSAQGMAMVVSGWSQLGTLEVVTNPGLAYRDLWQVFREQSVLFLVIALCAYVLADLALRYLLQPLRQVERQATAICEQQFVVQETLPRTRELRQVVMAINRMVRKLQQIFAEQVALIESLRLQSYTDPVTRISNRRDFDARLQAVIDRGEKRNGVMILLQIQQFADFNQQHGRSAGDECLQSLAKKLETTFVECTDAILGRRGGADFAVYLPGFPVERSKLLVGQFLLEVANSQLLKEASLNIGIAYTTNLTPEHGLLSKADLALRQAQSRGPNEWQLHREENMIEVARQAHQWFTLLQRVLQLQQVTLYGQAVFNRQREKVATEILCRVEDGSQLMNAGVFFPMVERFGLSTEFDRLIFSKVAEKSLENEMLVSINLSPQTIGAPGFLLWMETFLQTHRGLAKRLVLEMPAHTVTSAEALLRQLAAMVKPYGTTLALDHFGAHSAVFSYLHSLPLRYLKVDRSFIKDIHQNTDNQFFVKSLAQIAHSCDVLLFAEGVELEAEWSTLLELGLDGAQGYYLARPVVLS